MHTHIHIHMNMYSDLMHIHIHTYMTVTIITTIITIILRSYIMFMNVTVQLRLRSWQCCVCAFCLISVPRTEACGYWLCYVACCFCECCNCFRAVNCYWCFACYLGWHKGGCNKQGCTPGQLLFWTLENHPSVEGLCAPSMRVTSWICEFNACANIL